MRKLLSLLVMLLCTITTWAQSPLENPTYFQVPSSPYVFYTTPENVKGAYMQGWIHTDAAGWQTVASANNQWYGYWNPDTEEYIPYDSEHSIGYEGMQVRNQDGTGRRLYMYVKNVNTITGFFTTNNKGRKFMITVFDTDGNVVKTDTVGTINEASTNGAILKMTGLDETQSYKVLLESNNGNCWVQAVKFEGTARARHDSHIYLQREGNFVFVKNVAEGEVVRYLSSAEPITGRVTTAAAEFPAKGLNFKPNTPLYVSVRAWASAEEGAEASDTWSDYFYLDVPTVASDYLVCAVKADTAKTSVGFNNFSDVYTNTTDVLWTTTATDYQYIYKAQPGAEKVVGMDGTEYDLPAVSFNRKNSLFFNITEPYIFKVTTAVYLKNGTPVTNGTHVQMDGAYYEVGDDRTFSINLEPGLHEFIACKWGAEPGVQLIELKKGYDPYVDANNDIIFINGIQTQISDAVKGNEEYLTEALTKRINAILTGNYPELIYTAYEESQTTGKYVSPIDRTALQAEADDIVATIKSSLPVYTKDGVVGDGTELSEGTPYFNTPVKVEGFAKNSKVVVKGWDGVEGSNLTIYLNAIAQDETISYAIAGIEQTVNGTVVSSYDTEEDPHFVYLLPQDGKYSQVNVVLGDEMTNVLIGTGEEEGMGQLSLAADFIPVSDASADEDDLGMSMPTPIQGVYMVTWPGTPIAMPITLAELQAIKLPLGGEQNVAVNLVDAKVTYYNAEMGLVIIEDAEGAAMLGLNEPIEGLAAGKALTGKVKGVYMNQYAPDSEILFVEIADVTMADADVKKGREVVEPTELLRPENKNRLVTVTNSMMCPITVGEDGVFVGDVMVYDVFYGLGEEFVWPERVKTLTGVMYYGYGQPILVPRSADDVVAAAPAIVAPDDARYFWASNADAEVTEVGGMAEASEAAAGRVNYGQAGFYTICLNGKKDFSDACYITVTMDEPLVKGDTIFVTAFKNKNADGKTSGAKFSFDDANSNILGTGDVFNNIYEGFQTGDGKPNTVAVVVTEAQAGCTTFKMTRENTGTNLFITQLYIKKWQDPTAINNAVVNNNVPAGTRFNLAGQKVSNTFKGLVIEGGKKIVKK